MKPSASKFAFFGTPYVARDTLAALIENGLRPAVVVTNPDAPRGRGHAMAPTETKVLAESHGLPVLTPARLDDDAIEAIKSFGADFAIVVAYGKILPLRLIEAFPKGIFNIHYSLLPKYRGASPVEAALLSGDAKTGVTIQKMVYELDAGDIAASAAENILPTDTTATLRPRLVGLGARLLLDIWPAITAGSVALAPQDHSAATFSGKLKKEDGLLDLMGDQAMNWRKYRAFAEWPGTYFFANGKRMKIKRARFENDHFIVERVIPEGGKEIDYRL